MIGADVEVVLLVVVLVVVLLVVVLLVVVVLVVSLLTVRQYVAETKYCAWLQDLQKAMLAPSFMSLLHGVLQSSA